MEKQLFQVVTLNSEYQKIRDKLTDWVIVENYTDSKSKHVLVRPSLNYETVSYNEGVGYRLKTTVILYFFDDCNVDKIYELFTSLNFKVLSCNENWEQNSRELEIKNNAVLKYTKFVIDYQFIKSLSCISC